MADIKREPIVGIVQHSETKLNQKVFHFLQLVKSILIVFIMSVPEFIKSFVDIIVPGKKKNIRGWTALVTGGGNGLGSLMAEELAKHGCNVAVVDIDGDAAKKIAVNLRKYNVKSFGYQVDVSSFKAVENVKSLIEKDIGPVDMLINNAAILPLLHMWDETNENINRISSVNIKSCIYTTHIFLSGMIERKRGHIVTLSSILGQHATAFTILYCSSKFSITGFALSLEEELRQERWTENIKSSIVYPFFIATRKDMTDSINTLYPMLDPAETAKAVIEGILQNKREIFIHPVLKPLFKLDKFFPSEVEDLARIHALREKQIYYTSMEGYLKKYKSTTKMFRYLNEEKYIKQIYFVCFFI